MAMSITLQQYLDDQHISYDCLVHDRTGCSSESAEASHIPGACIAKAVVLKRRDGFVLAVVPASEKVRLENVGRQLGQPVALATEDEIASLFPDCEPGAVPPIANAYGVASLVDDTFERLSDIYFEAGDHQTLAQRGGAGGVTTVPCQ